jgi:hypothetical protein
MVLFALACMLVCEGHETGQDDGRECSKPVSHCLQMPLALLSLRVYTLISGIHRVVLIQDALNQLPEIKAVDVCSLLPGNAQLCDFSAIALTKQRDLAVGTKQGRLALITLPNLSELAEHPACMHCSAQVHSTEVTAVACIPTSTAAGKADEHWLHGWRALLASACSFGTVVLSGIQGASSYGSMCVNIIAVFSESSCPILDLAVLWVPVPDVLCGKRDCGQESDEAVSSMAAVVSPDLGAVSRRSPDTLPCGRAGNQLIHCLDGKPQHAADGAGMSLRSVQTDLECTAEEVSDSPVSHAKAASSVTEHRPASPPVATKSVGDCRVPNAVPTSFMTEHRCTRLEVTADDVNVGTAQQASLNVLTSPTSAGTAEVENSAAPENVSVCAAENRSAHSASDGFEGTQALMVYGAGANGKVRALRILAAGACDKLSLCDCGSLPGLAAPSSRPVSLAFLEAATEVGGLGSRPESGECRNSSAESERPPWLLAACEDRCIRAWSAVALSQTTLPVPVATEEIVELTSDSRSAPCTSALQTGHQQVDVRNIAAPENATGTTQNATSVTHESAEVCGVSAECFSMQKGSHCVVGDCSSPVCSAQNPAAGKLTPPVPTSHIHSKKQLRPVAWGSRSLLEAYIHQSISSLDTPLSHKHEVRLPGGLSDTGAADSLISEAKFCDAVPQVLLSKGVTGRAAQVAATQAAALPLLWKGSVDAAVSLVADAGALNADFVAIAAGAGVEAWKAVVNAYAQKLEAIGEVHLAVAYLCAASNFEGAVSAYRRQGLLEEAVLLAERHLPSHSELSLLRQQLLLKLQRAAGATGSLGTAVWAASVAVQLGKHADAIAALATIQGGSHAQLRAAQLACETRVPELVRLGCIFSAEHALSELSNTNSALPQMLWRHDRVVRAIVWGTGAVGVLLEALIMCCVTLQAHSPPDRAPDFALAMHAAAAAVTIADKTLKQVPGMPAALSCAGGGSGAALLCASNVLRRLVMSFTLELLTDTVLVTDASCTAARLSDGMQGRYADFASLVMAEPAPDVADAPDVVAGFADLVAQVVDAAIAESLPGSIAIGSEMQSSCDMEAMDDGQSTHHHADKLLAGAKPHMKQLTQPTSGNPGMEDKCVSRESVIDGVLNDKCSAAAEMLDVVGLLVCGIWKKSSEGARPPVMHATHACALTVLQCALSEFRAASIEDSTLINAAEKTAKTAWAEMLQSLAPLKTNDGNVKRNCRLLLGQSVSSLFAEPSSRQWWALEPLAAKEDTTRAEEPTACSQEVQPAYKDVTHVRTAASVKDFVDAPRTDGPANIGGENVCARSQPFCDSCHTDVEEPGQHRGLLDVPDAQVCEGALDELAALLRSSDSSGCENQAVVYAGAQGSVLGLVVARDVVTLQKEKVETLPVPEAFAGKMQKERDPDARAQVHVTSAVGDGPLYPGLSAQYVQSFQKTEQVYSPQDWPRLLRQLRHDAQTSSHGLWSRSDASENVADVCAGAEASRISAGIVIQGSPLSGGGDIVARMWKASIAAHPVSGASNL